MRHFITLASIISLSFLLSCSSDDDENTNSLAVDKTELLFNNQVTEETLTFNIISNDSWIITTINDNSWLSIDKTEGKGNAEIKVTAEPNSYGIKNNWDLTIKSVNNSNNIIEVNVKQTFEAINILDYILDTTFKNYLIENVFEGKIYVSQVDAAKIKTLDVSGTEDQPNAIASLDGIHFFKGLRVLECSYNQLTILDVSKNKYLTSLYCQKNELIALDLSHNKELDWLNCIENQLTTLDLSQVQKLNFLDCGNNQLTTLDVSKNTLLLSLGCENNELTTLDISQNKELAILWCSENQLTTLDISQNEKLIWLYCITNQLTTLDLRNNPVLAWVNCNDNPLESIAKSVIIPYATYNSMKDNDIQPSKSSNIYDVIN